MGLHLLIAALAASAAMAADPCACVNPTQTIDTINSPMIFFQQPTLGGVMNGVTCSMNCDFIANLDAGADDDSALQIQLLSSKLGDGSLSVEGMNDTLTIGSNTPTGTLYPKSTGTQIKIHFTEGATNNGEFMIVVQKVKGRPAPSEIKTTTPAPVTAPYDPKFTHNPLLVANDIMLVFDLSSKDIEKYKTFAQGLIKELSFNPKSLDNADKEDCGVGSRLSVVGLSAMSGFNNLYAPYWTTSYTQADGNIKSLVQLPSSSRFIITPLAENYIYGFDRKSDAAEEIYTTCKNRGKILILLTSTSPNEYDIALQPGKDPLNINFLDKGVHQILVNSNIDAKEKKFYDISGETKADNAWNFFSLGGGDKDIETFFNSFLVDSKEPMTCQLTSNDKKIEVPIGKFGSNVPVNIPPYYNARTSVGTEDWITPRHYCNFQETTVRLVPDDTIKGRTENQKICVKVFYDLETGKDFVSIFSGDPNVPSNQEEVVRLTGRDVSGTTFELPDAVGSIVFSSDEKTVYDGFHADIKPC